MAARRYYRTAQAVDAIQYDGTNIAELDRWIDAGHFDYNQDLPIDDEDRAGVLVADGHTWRPLHPGNWVISWDNGEYAVLRDDEFRAAYSLDGA